MNYLTHFELFLLITGFFVFGYSLGVRAGERREQREQRLQRIAEMRRKIQR